MSYQNRIVVKNAKQTMDALKAFDPEAQKEIAKRISKAAGTVVSNARSMMPSGNALSGWGRWTAGARDLGYRDSNRKVRVTRANNRKRGEAVSNYIGIVNPTAGGAIFELAGRQTSGYFVEALHTKGYGRSSKENTQRPGVFKAFDEDKNKAVAEIETSLRDAETKLQSILNAMGG